MKKLTIRTRRELSAQVELINYRLRMHTHQVYLGLVLLKKNGRRHGGE